MKQLMLGSFAVARGAYESGCRFVAAYPGRISSDITRQAAEYSEIHTQYAANETVAFESAVGASIAGARAMAVMTDLNVAANVLCAASCTGVNGGLVVAVVDSSGHGQDSRRHEVAAAVPVLEPSDAVECSELTKLAFELSEELDTPVVLRLSASVAHFGGNVEPSERAERELIPYRKKTEKYVLLPENARNRRKLLEERGDKLIAWTEARKINSAVIYGGVEDIEILSEQNEAQINRAQARAFCLGCPHRGVFYVLNKLWLRVIGDLGCSTLGALPPFLALDAAWCTGASIATLGGLHAVLGKKSLRDTVAVIGDSAFCHSGMAGLLDLVNNVGAGTVLILDNGTAAAAGRMPTPLKAPVSLERICEGLGVSRVSVVDPFELELLERTVREELATDDVSVIICRRDCALLSKLPADVTRYEVYTDRCRGCRSCHKLGCPAITPNGKRAIIDSKKCVGCGLCSQLCKCDAIRPLRNGTN